jgi:adenine/guanine phosphoribosyltransferase-like PRPP-binding protein
MADPLRAAFDDRPMVEIKGKRFVINPLTEQVPATPAEMLVAAAWQLVEIGDFSPTCTVVGEEDKGGILVAAVAMVTGRPFGLARWYPSGLAGQISVDFSSEYADGRIYLNGVEAGDEVVIVDDLVSTGGTMIALIRAIEEAGAVIRDIVCVAEKVEYEGRQRIKEQTGHDVKCLLQLSIAGPRCKVL